MNKDALTAVEVAEMLNIAKNTVYKLVKTGELNCYMVGRKMRFTYNDVQTYINRSRSGSPIQTIPNEKRQTRYQMSIASGDSLPVIGSQSNVFRICGHDEILDLLSRNMMAQLPDLKTERIHKGSYDALSMLYKDQVSAAASHMWDAKTNTYNTPFLSSFLPGCPVVCIHICNRTEGFYVKEGNPKDIKNWEDLSRPDIILANREPGAGSRILMDAHLERLGINGYEIQGYNMPLKSHLAVAGAVSKGTADIGVGTQKTALGIRGISFIPLQEERYDLIIKKRDLNKEAVQVMLSTLNSFEFQEEFRYSNGYDVTGMGEITEP